MNELVSLLPIIGIILVFWLLIVRPQSKRQRALAQLQNALEPGNEVMLTSGFYGVVDSIADDRINLRVAEGVTIQVARGAVASVVPADEPEPTDSPEDPPTHTTPGA